MHLDELISKDLCVFGAVFGQLNQQVVGGHPGLRGIGSGIAPSFPL